MASILRIFLLAAALMITHIPAQAAESFSADQKATIENIVKSYLAEHPEAIVESLNSYQLKQQEEQSKKAETALKENMGSLTSADAPSAGNPKGTIVVVEFFDYNCGYCKRALPDIQKLVAEQKDVRVVFKEMPILGPTSMTAAQWAVAAHKQGKYFEFHSALMNHRGDKDEKSLEKIAKDLGLDVAKMKKDAASPEVGDHIRKDLDMAQKIGVNGTPAFVINGKFFPGYLGPEGLKQSIEEARKSSQ